MIATAWIINGVLTSLMPGEDWPGTPVDSLEFLRTFESESWEGAVRQFNEWLDAPIVETEQ